MTCISKEVDNYMRESKWEIRIAKLTGFFFPFITLRMDIFTYSITMYMLFLLMLCLIVILKDGISLTITKLDILVYSFMLILLISTSYSLEIMYGIERFMKFFIIVAIYFVIKEVFKKRINLISIIMKYSILGGVILLCYLGYVYFIQFNENYISLNTDYASKGSKNSLAFMCTVLSATMFAYLIKIKNSERYIIIKTFFIVIGLLLMLAIQSRGLFLILLIYFTYFIFKSLFYKKMKVFLISLITVPILMYFVIPREIINDVFQRYMSLSFLFEPEIIENNYSFATRSDLIDRAINIFIESPFIGIGLGSFQYFGDEKTHLSHNDYLLVLSEQGLIGLFIFILMLVSVVIMSIKNIRIESNFVNTSLLLSIIGLSVYLLFINAYDNILLWTIIGFISSISQNNNIINEKV